MSSVLKELAKPFPPDKIKWRKGGNGYLAYIDARHLMNRLDEVVGPENWEDSYEETPKGRVLCKLSLCIDGQWISKSDGAGDTAFEGEKGGISDAFKRAGVKWGIGRYLYELPIAATPEEGMSHLMMTDEFARRLADLVDNADPETGEGVDAFGEAWVELGEPVQRAFGKYISTFWPGGVSAAKQKMRDIMTAYRERLNQEVA